MLVIDPYFVVEDNVDGIELLKRIEKAGRTCYKSEQKINELSCFNFIRMIINRGHESVLEHEKITVRIVCDRGISHEIVRHRIASYSQESTRYCNYSDDKFGREITFIKPLQWDECSKEYLIWYNAMLFCEKSYMSLVDQGVSPQMARSVLPNSLKTEIVVTMNLREWRHFFTLRTSEAAHPQMRQIACPLLSKLKEVVPVVFDDIKN